jgi:hypothetical protein
MLKNTLRRARLNRPAAAIIRYARRPAAIGHDLAVADDLRELRRTHQFLGETRAADDYFGPVLVMSMVSFPYHLKTESLLAKALEVNGAEPVFLTYSSLRHARRIYRTFGFDRLVFFDEHLPAQMPSDVVSAVEALLEDTPTLDAVKAFTYHGVEVGRQALATLLRNFHLGRLDFGDARIERELASALDRGVRSVVAAESILDRLRPRLGIINDAMYVGVGGVFESALNRGIPVIQWVGAQRDDALVLKRFSADTKREHPFSLAPETWERVLHERWTAHEENELFRDFEERYVDARWTSYYNRPFGSLLEERDVVVQLGLDPEKKTAVIFPHILWDSTLFWGEDLFVDYQDWLVESVRAGMSNEAVNWVVKLHPANTWKLRRDRVADRSAEERVLERAFGRLPDHVKLVPADGGINTFSLFPVTDYCLTVRGTIGIEMAAFGIPVLTAGTGRYSRHGFTIDSQTREEYLARLARIQDVPPLSPEQVELARRYAHALFVRRPTRFTSFRTVYRPISQAGHPLDHNLLIELTSSHELRTARDLQAFGGWALASDEPDFLVEATRAEAFERA